MDGKSRAIGLAISSLLLLLLASTPIARQVGGPYSLQLCLDITDYLFVGAVVGTDEYDPSVRRRVSRIEIQRSLYGGLAVGDTLAADWSAKHTMRADGIGTTVHPSGPQLSELAGPHIWLIMEDDGRTRCTCDPIPIGQSSRAEIATQLKWARQERIPYRGTLADPEQRRARSIDVAAGDTLRVVLAAYLAERLDAAEGEWPYW
jgi:hypothetical protein